MAKAYGRRPAEWLDPYIIEDDPLMAYQWDRMVFYAGTLWEAEDREAKRPKGSKGRRPPRKLSKAEIQRIKARSKMSIEDRRKAGHFGDLKGLAQPGIKKVKIPDSGVW